LKTILSDMCIKIWK